MVYFKKKKEKNVKVFHNMYQKIWIFKFVISSNSKLSGFDIAFFNCKISHLPLSLIFINNKTNRSVASTAKIYFPNQRTISMCLTNFKVSSNLVISSPSRSFV